MTKNRLLDKQKEKDIIENSFTTKTINNLLDEKKLVVKTNTLVESRYRLTISQQKLVLLLISQIKKNDEEFKTYRFTVKEIADILNLESKTNIYKYLKKITEDLLKQVLKISFKDKNNEPKLLQTNWIASALYHEGKGFFDLRISPDLKPFLLQIQGKFDAFTKYQIKEVLELKSVFSIRFYELLKSNEYKQEFIISIEKIKTIFGIEDKYKKYSHFKKEVINKAKQELKEKANLYFEYEEIKTGRKITDLKIFIFRKEEAEEEKKLVISKEQEKDINNLCNTINKIINKTRFNASNFAFKNIKEDKHPKSILNALNGVLANYEFIEDLWAYGTKIVNKLSPEYYAKDNEKKNEKLKKETMPDNLKDMLKKIG